MQDLAARLIAMTELRTQRLLLRDWRPSDLDAFAALNADPVVMEHFADTITREQSDQLAEVIRLELAVEGWGLWATEVPGVSDFIGFIGLHRATWEAPFNPSVEIGWRLVHSAWGHGYAPEGAREVLRFAFEEAGLHEVTSFTYEGNLRSRRVMEKIGLSHDPSDDFEHPNVPVGHRIRPHVVYRGQRPAR